ncbi:unannotated protein [freshwater metagenome]|uniref:Unannotated protein n=1 Tax=freshwater metagenome TaxID=449393 RepID=A0A6J6EPE1_9ZZZZ
MDLHCLTRDPLSGLAHVGLDHRSLEEPPAVRHHLGDLIGELTSGLSEHHHAAELGLGELVVGDGLAKDDAVERVLMSIFVCGLHDADGTSSGLQTAVFETSHLVIETLAEAFVATNLICLGHKPVIERDFVGVHAAVADGVDCSAFHLSATGCAAVDAGLLNKSETVAFATGLGHHKHRECFVRE